jgi:predicted NACHT family NTPase
MNVARVICSCRSGDAPHAEGFSTAELVPLSSEQIGAIVKARTEASSEFLERVSSAGIAIDILNRPLFLNQLLTVFETTGSLPERPVDLNRQLLRLLLHDWDQQRRVQRRSVYADFDGEVKKDFLSEVAFRLTLQGLAKFSENDLLAIYKDSHGTVQTPGAAG